jgi:hypothetical protein
MSYFLLQADFNQTDVDLLGLQHHLRGLRQQHHRLAARRRNFVLRYERLLDFEISNSISGVLDVLEKIDNLRFIENEAKYSGTKDEAIIEGMQRIKEKISSEGDYDRRRRQQRVANLRNAATAIEALYRRLDEPEEEQSF